MAIKTLIDGYTFRAGALAYRLDNGTFDVYCCVCSKGIGTFTSEILTHAIMKSLDRGGVRCPECRKLTCQFCYVISEDRKPLTTVLFRLGEGKSEVMKVCSICRLEVEEDPQSGIVVTEFSEDLSGFAASYADADNPKMPTSVSPEVGTAYRDLSDEKEEIEGEWDARAEDWHVESRYWDDYVGMLTGE